VPPAAPTAPATTAFPSIAPDKAASAQMAAAVLAAAERPTMAIAGGPPAAPVLSPLPVHAAGLGLEVAPPPAYTGTSRLVSANGAGSVGELHAAGDLLVPGSAGDFDWGALGDDAPASGRMHKRNLLLLVAVVAIVGGLLFLGYRAGSKLFSAAPPSPAATKQAGQQLQQAEKATQPEGEAPVDVTPAPAGSDATGAKAAAKQPASGSGTTGTGGGKAGNAPAPVESEAADAKTLNSAQPPADGSTDANGDPFTPTA
jgi:hypothetical protein